MKKTKMSRDFSIFCKKTNILAKVFVYYTDNNIINLFNGAQNCQEGIRNERYNVRYDKVPDNRDAT